jgi:hypothetical protein
MGGAYHRCNPRNNFGNLPDRQLPTGDDYLPCRIRTRMATLYLDQDDDRQDSYRMATEARTIGGAVAMSADKLTKTTRLQYRLITVLSRKPSLLRLSRPVVMALYRHYTMAKPRVTSTTVADATDVKPPLERDGG